MPKLSKKSLFSVFVHIGISRFWEFTIFYSTLSFDNGQKNYTIENLFRQTVLNYQNIVVGVNLN